MQTFIVAILEVILFVLLGSGFYHIWLLRKLRIQYKNLFAHYTDAFKKIEDLYLGFDQAGADAATTTLTAATEKDATVIHTCVNLDAMDVKTPEEFADRVMKKLFGAVRVEDEETSKKVH